MGGMLYFNIVYLRMIGHFMGAGCRVFPDRGDGKAMFTIVHVGVHIPSFYPADLVDNTFGQGDGGAAWSVFLLGMMGFFQAYLVIRLTIHDLGQEPVDFEENIYSHAIVGGIKKA